MEPDQTAPIGPVSKMFASKLMLNRHFQMQLFCWRFKDYKKIKTEVMAKDDPVSF